MGAKTIRASVSVLKQAYDQAIREQLMTVNPVNGVQLPSVKRRASLKVWTPAEIARFLEASASDPLTPLWHLLVLEGMRRSEALGLRWSDLHRHDDGTVTAHISQTVIADNTAGGRALITDRTKTDAGARSVLLTKETIRAIDAHRTRQVFTRKKAGDVWHSNDLIVCTSHGTPIDPNNVERNQARIMKAAVVPVLTTHSLRHTAATLMLLSRVPIKMVSEKLGHASVTITLDIYSHVLPNMQQMAADAMDAALARGREENLIAIEAAL
jgi:integrase